MAVANAKMTGSKPATSRHFSASQINTFLAEPALWVLQQFHGVRPEVGAAAWRGSAVEAALDYELFKPGTDLADLEAIALQQFENDAQGDLSDDVEKERGNIKAVLANLIPWVREQGWPAPTTRQQRIEWVPDGAQTPVIGYTDYVWSASEPQAILDLKAPGRAPSFDKETGLIKDKADHLRQVAIYRAARDLPVGLLYAMPAKNRAPILYWPTEAELNQALSEVRAAVRAMETVWNMETVEAEGLFPPRDINGFRWDENTKRTAADIWRLEVA